MKKNSIIGAGLITLAATFALTGCNKSAPEEKNQTLKLRKSPQAD